MLVSFSIDLRPDLLVLLLSYRTHLDHLGSLLRTRHSLGSLPAAAEVDRTVEEEEVLRCCTAAAAGAGKVHSRESSSRSLAADTAAEEEGSFGGEEGGRIGLEEKERREGRKSETRPVDQRDEIERKRNSPPCPPP